MTDSSTPLQNVDQDRGTVCARYSTRISCDDGQKSGTDCPLKKDCIMDSHIPHSLYSVIVSLEVQEKQTAATCDYMNLVVPEHLICVTGK